MEERDRGYAYAGAYRPRPAYRFTVENSIYLAAPLQRRIGTRLLQQLIEDCASRGFRQMIAVIGDSDNAASVGVHARAGFDMIGTHPGVGFKFGRWLATVMMQRALGDGGATTPHETRGDSRRATRAARARGARRHPGRGGPHAGRERGGAPRTGNGGRARGKEGGGRRRRGGGAGPAGVRGVGEPPRQPPFRKRGSPQQEVTRRRQHPCNQIRHRCQRHRRGTGDMLSLELVRLADVDQNRIPRRQPLRGILRRNGLRFRIRHCGQPFLQK